MKSARAALLVLLLFGGGCNNNTDSPTSPSEPAPTVVTELFAGSLAASGSAFYSFSVRQNTNVNLTLVSLTNEATGATLDPVVQIGFGVPSGTGCGVTRSVSVPPGLSAQIVHGVTPSIYCVRIADIGNLPGPAGFAIRISSGSSTEAPASATETFASRVGPRGSASRSFNATQTGQVTVTLDTLDPSPAGLVGLGLGVPGVDGTGCILTRSVQTMAGPGPQMTMPVDRGSYCVKIFDIGTLTVPINFSIRIARP